MPTVNNLGGLFDPSDTTRRNTGLVTGDTGSVEDVLPQVDMFGTTLEQLKKLIDTYTPSSWAFPKDRFVDLDPDNPLTGGWTSGGNPADMGSFISTAGKPVTPLIDGIEMISAALPIKYIQGAPQAIIDSMPWVSANPYDYDPAGNGRLDNLGMNGFGFTPINQYDWTPYFAQSLADVATGFQAWPIPFFIPSDGFDSTSPFNGSSTLGTDTDGDGKGDGPVDFVTLAADTAKAVNPFIDNLSVSAYNTASVFQKLDPFSVADFKPFMNEPLAGSIPLPGGAMVFSDLGEFTDTPEYTATIHWGDAIVDGDGLPKLT